MFGVKNRDFVLINLKARTGHVIPSMGRAKLFFLGLRREINLFGTNLKYILLINIPIELKFYGVKTKITHEVPLPCLGMCKITMDLTFRFTFSLE